MNKLKTLLASCALILAFNTPAMSDSSNFAGPYIGLQASSIGAGVGGKKTGGTVAVMSQLSVGLVNLA